MGVAIEQVLNVYGAAKGRRNQFLIPAAQPLLQLRHVGEDRSPLEPVHILASEVIEIRKMLFENALEEAEGVLVNESSAWNPMGTAIWAGNKLEVVSAGEPRGVRVKFEVEVYDQKTSTSSCKQA